MAIGIDPILIRITKQEGGACGIDKSIGAVLVIFQFHRIIGAKSPAEPKVAAIQGIISKCQIAGIGITLLVQRHGRHQIAAEQIDPIGHPVPIRLHGQQIVGLIA